MTESGYTSASFVAEVREAALGQVSSEAEDGHQPEFGENAFTKVMLEHLADSGDAEDFEVCYSYRSLEGRVAQVNAWSLDDDGESAGLAIALFKGVEALGTFRGADVEEVVCRAKTFVELVRRGMHDKMERASDQFQMYQALHQHLKALDNARIYVLVYGQVDYGSDIERRREERRLGVHIWDVERLVASRANEQTGTGMKVDFVERYGMPLPCLKMEGHGEEYDAYLAILPGRYLHDLYQEHGARLLDLNVRSFLQSRGKVNRGIRETLSAEPARFFAYNNGISATADSVEIVSADSGRGMGIRTIGGFQVVNGGQTMASIHQSMASDGSTLEGVSVQAKITVVPPTALRDFAPKIARFANSQNKVNEADFSTNDPFSLAIEEHSRSVWCPSGLKRWFYERSRGQYQVERAAAGTSLAARKAFEEKCPPQLRMTKTDLAKYINAWQESPHIVSRGAQKNFASFMDKIHEERGTTRAPTAEGYKAFVAMAILFRQADDLARALRIPSYRANVVAYAVSCLAHMSVGRLNLAEVWNNQEASKGQRGALEAWMPKLHRALQESAGARNVTEWCKKRDCWDYIRALEFPVPPDLQGEWDAATPVPTVGAAAKRGQTRVTADEAESIAKVMRIRPDAWIRIISWGLNTGTLNEVQRGICMTLAGYAKDRWKKIPSSKQAISASKYIDRAIAAKIIGEADWTS